jgi:hypothetical protein
MMDHDDSSIEINVDVGDLLPLSYIPSNLLVPLGSLVSELWSFADISFDEGGTSLVRGGAALSSSAGQQKDDGRC